MVVQRYNEGCGDIADVDEIPSLLAVLEYHRALAVGNTRGEDSEDAGVGIESACPGP